MGESKVAWVTGKEGGEGDGDWKGKGRKSVVGMDE